MNPPTDKQTPEAQSLPKPWYWEIAALLGLLIALSAPFVYLARHNDASPAIEQKVTFVGSASCKKCHPAQFDQWKGSDHDLAMAEATEETVLGDFNDQRFYDPHAQKWSRFFREDGRFMVETEGPNGQPATFTITHTFGHFPLQQYLVPFPGGRLQCLPIAWDVQQKTWYRLPPYEVKGPDDWLHWTQGGQTWNGMCAECHSTNLNKGYNLETDQYQTSWSEINVGCEACHGPGSRHIAWAEQPAMGRQPAANYDLVVQSQNQSPEAQIALCAPCHARRYQLGDNQHQAVPDVLDTMVPSLLTDDLYHPDGQIKEEVYVYGSFSQSKMYHHGVRCSDCHNIHTLKPVLDHKDSNALCLQCHKRTEYDTDSHHFHKKFYQGKRSQGASCVACHMPGQYYMGIDYRPDHSIRIPRPDLSQKLGTPNSCATNGCHQDKPSDWIMDHYQKWYGKARKPHYGETLSLGQSGDANAVPALQELAEDTLQPAIVRATALHLLQNYPGPEALSAAKKALQDDASILRHTALRLLGQTNQETIRHLIPPKLYDPVRAVRLEAAVQMSRLPEHLIREQDKQVLRDTLDQYRQAMVYNSDFAPQRYNLANLERNAGNTQAAIDLYRQAIGIDEEFYPAKVNLAMELNAQGENQEAVALLTQVATHHPELGQVAYSLGLLLAEMQHYEQALPYLKKAAQQLSHNLRIQYNLALALFKLGEFTEGITVLERLVDAEPDNQEYFVTLASLYLNQGQMNKARDLAEKTLRKIPDHQQAGELLQITE